MYWPPSVVLVLQVCPTNGIPAVVSAARLSAAVPGCTANTTAGFAAMAASTHALPFSAVWSVRHSVTARGRPAMPPVRLISFTAALTP